MEEEEGQGEGEQTVAVVVVVVERRDGVKEGRKRFREDMLFMFYFLYGEHGAFFFSF